MFDFLQQLEANNNKTWFLEHKEAYELAKSNAWHIFESIHKEIIKLDEVGPVKMYRIYNDLRFFKNKPPYKDHFGAIIPRVQPYNRGSFYIHLQPNNSFVGGGFYAPNTEDLLRIRKAFAYEDEIEHIIKATKFQKIYSDLKGNDLKTAPKGFDKNHERIKYIKKKQFIISHSFSDDEVLDKNFASQVAQCYEAAIPFFKYMTDVLITDANGELLIK